MIAEEVDRAVYYVGEGDMCIIDRAVYYVGEGGI